MVNPLVLGTPRCVLSRNFDGINAKLQGHGKLIWHKRPRSPNMAAVTAQSKLSTQRQKTTIGATPENNANS
jgi:hypothetical protein